MVGLRKITKNSVMLVGYPAEIRTQHVLNTNHNLSLSQFALKMLITWATCD
jgi:hypothetical protein